MDDFISQITAFVIILVPLIFIHELGHFIMAKLAGITVLEFGIGFPPRAMLLFKRGDTEYTLNWLPLGGFVRPLGEDLVAPLSDEETDKAREKYRALRSDGTEEVISDGVAVSDVPPARRLLFFVGGPVFNVILAVLLFAAAGIVGQPVIDHADITVAALDWDSPFLYAGLRPGDVVRAVDGQPVGYDQESREHSLRFVQDLVGYLAADTPVTLTIERDGVLQDITVTPDDPLSVRFTDAGDVLISQVSETGPAHEAGIRADDIVLGGYAQARYPVAGRGVAYTDAGIRALDANAQRFYNATEMSQTIHAAAGLPFTMTLRRGEETFDLTMRTRRTPPPGEGPTGIMLFTDLPMTIAYETPVEALGNGVSMMALTTVRTLEIPLMIARGEIGGDGARLVSIVGISQVGGQIVQESVDVQTPAPLLNFAGYISVALGIANLLPIPALDGGRILFTLIELIRGKRMNPAREGMIHMIGLMALLALMVVLIFTDLLYPIQLP